MAQINTDFKLPRDKSARIWRYVDFAKFMSMLVRKGLFFSHNSDFVSYIDNLIFHIIVVRKGRI